MFGQINMLKPQEISQPPLPEGVMETFRVGEKIKTHPQGDCDYEIKELQPDGLLVSKKGESDDFKLGWEFVLEVNPEGSIFDADKTLNLHDSEARVAEKPRKVESVQYHKIGDFVSIQRGGRNFYEDGWQIKEVHWSAGDVEKEGEFSYLSNDDKVILSKVIDDQKYEVSIKGEDFRIMQSQIKENKVISEKVFRADHGESSPEMAAAMQIFGLSAGMSNEEVNQAITRVLKNVHPTEREKFVSYINVIDANRTIFKK